MSIRKPAVLFIFGALSAGVFAGPAPSANATCASFFGIGNSANCSSTQTSIAIAIGPSAQAHAFGSFDTSLALGSHAVAYSYQGGGQSAIALGNNAIASAGGIGTNWFSGATAIGDGSTAATYGTGSLAFAAHGKASSGGIGTFGDVAIAVGTTGVAKAGADGVADLAVDAFGHGDVGSVGVGNVAVNLGGSNVFVTARGTLNNATALLGSGNSVDAGANVPATGSWAFAVLGKGNTVHAGPGPLAVAGSILQTNAMVTKYGPGFNINGVVAGGAAAVPSAQAKSSTKPPSHAGSKRHVHA